MSKKVLIVGGGGRECAIAKKIHKQSPEVEIFIAPGNGGTEEFATNIPIKPTEIDGLVKFAKENKIDLTIVGPDDPLALGIVNIFRENSLKIFGPSKAAAEIEWSKAFAKGLMERAEVPTAKSEIFQEHKKALDYVRKHGAPIVVKASGLAAGKGAYVCETIKEAEAALHEIMKENVHGKAGEEVVVEDFLDGPEFSVHVLCDGKNFVVFPPAQDHKRIGENDSGPNTGGMGTIAPVPWVTEEMMQEITDKIIKPTLEQMVNEGRPFTGLLFPGIKWTKDGPKVLEYNARFGDPETQVFMRLLESNLLELLEACADGKLNKVFVEWKKEFAACIVLASGGYPNKYETEYLINGIDEAEKLNNVQVYHAGTKMTPEGVVTSGGRVLNVTATGSELSSALSLAYEAVEKVKFKNEYHRLDIGKSSLEKLEGAKTEIINK